MIVFIRQALAIRSLLELYLFLIVALIFLLNGFFVILSSVILSSIVFNNGTAQVELWFAYRNTYILILPSLKLENGLKKHVRSVA